MTFNKYLTVGEYNAMSAEDKRKWDDQWLAASTGMADIVDVVPTGAIVNGTYEMADPKDMIGQ